MRRVRARTPRAALPAAMALLLGACASPPIKPPPSAPPVQPLVQNAAVAPPAATADADEPTSLSPWVRLRARFAMKGCDYRPEVQRWATIYTQHPRQFSSSWERAMPFLLSVIDAVEQRDLPGEFALLPYLESTYAPIASRGDRAAGMWQIVPDTARAAGLTVSAEYDGRLDAIASTSAALDLIEHYRDEFGDWRLADMAYNSGEYKVRKLLGERDAHSLSASDLGKLPFNRVTHEHLDRLLALSCIIDDPARFGVTLPEPGADDVFASLDLRAAMDLRLVARLARLDIDDVRRWNAGYRRATMPANGRHRVWLPKERIAHFEQAAAAIPEALWPAWREQRAPGSRSLASWAAEVRIPVDALAAANALDVGATVPRESTLLLPGAEPIRSEIQMPRGKHMRTILVARGDTLSQIASRNQIPLAELRRLNPGATGILRPGQQLCLDACTRAGAASGAAAP